MDLVFLDERWSSVISRYEELYLANPSTCLRSDRAIILEYLQAGNCFGFIEDGELVSFVLFSINEYLVGFVEKCFVLPNFRGRGLSKLMLSEVVKIATGCHCISIYAMCSPANKLSLNSFRGAGFCVAAKAICEGQSRVILKYEVSC